MKAKEKRGKILPPPPLPKVGDLLVLKVYGKPMKIGYCIALGNDNDSYKFRWYSELKSHPGNFLADYEIRSLMAYHNYVVMRKHAPKNP